MKKYKTLNERRKNIMRQRTNSPGKRVLSLLLAVLMICSILPMGVIAEVQSSDVCKIGDDGYGTFESALKAAVSGTDKIVLLKDITDDSGSTRYNFGSKILTLDLNGFDADAERPVTFSGLAGTGGVVKNGAVKLTGEWTISAQRFVDRTTTTITGTLDLSAVTKIVLTDAEVLDDEEVQGLRRMTLFSATDVIWPATLVIEGVPKGWSIKRSENGMRLGFDKGLVLTVR